MKRAALLTVVAAVVLAGLPALAQVTTSRPIQVKTKQPKPKIEKFKGQVLYCNVIQIMVQSTENTAFVRSFSYAPKLEERIQKMMERGGYQAGDIVEVHFEAGTNTAVRIKGKPSRPRR